MIGTADVMHSSKKQKRSVRDESPPSTGKRTSRFEYWAEGRESPRSRGSPGRPQQNGQSVGRKSPRLKGSPSTKRRSFVRRLERDITDSPPSPKIAPTSFYSSKRRRYLSPLERREARDAEEQRRKRLSDSGGEEKDRRKSPRKTPELSKTPKSGVKKPHGNRMTPSSGRNVNRHNTPGRGKTATSSEKKKIENSVNEGEVATRTSPRKKPNPSDHTPKKSLFKNHADDVNTDSAVRRSPRKLPQNQTGINQMNGQSSNANVNKKDTLLKKPSKGIKLYMQTLNKNRKSKTPKSASKSKSKTANKTPKSDKVQMPVFNKESSSMTKLTTESNKRDVKKSFNFFAEEDEEKETTFHTANNVEGVANTISDESPTQVTGRTLPSSNGNGGHWSGDADSTNKSPRKRKSEMTLDKTVKRRKADDVDINQDTPDSVENSEIVMKSTKKTAALKMFPIFTPPSTPKSANKIKLNVDSSPSSSASIFHRSPKQRKSPILKKSRNRDGKEQMILDLGQKRFGATMCPTCGMVYSVADPEDETDHIRFHNKFTECVKFPGWKKEHVLQDFHDGRIIVITSDDPKYALKKVEDVRELVDTELGFLQGSTTHDNDSKAFLFISNEKKVVGCCIAEKISKGYRVLTDNDQSDAEDSLEDRKRAWCCSNEPVAVICGISRIWVWGKMRRKKIASRLVDCLKCHYTYGYTLSNDDIAFSDPTPDGKIFATKYTGTAKFLVYNFTINSQ
ncbi:N-acetyltransferase ESCO2-like [Ptychodera flava]|uniref:N-acetyltransferase ESCO2-like n=1 Tax=Ptychodera flava TaxID=63121 RepID=UPI00396A2745